LCLCPCRQAQLAFPDMAKAQSAVRRCRGRLLGQLARDKKSRRSPGAPALARAEHPHGSVWCRQTHTDVRCVQGSHALTVLKPECLLRDIFRCAAGVRRSLSAAMRPSRRNRPHQRQSPRAKPRSPRTLRSRKLMPQLQGTPRAWLRLTCAAQHRRPPRLTRLRWTARSE